VRPQGIAFAYVYINVKSEIDLLKVKNQVWDWNPEFKALLTPTGKNKYKGTLLFTELEAREVCYHSTKKADVPIQFEGDDTVKFLEFSSLGLFGDNAAGQSCIKLPVDWYLNGWMANLPFLTMNKLSGNKGGSFTVTLIAKDGINDDLVAVLTLEFECNNTRKDDDPEFCKNCCIGDKKPEEA